MAQQCFATQHSATIAAVSLAQRRPTRLAMSMTQRRAAAPNTSGHSYDTTPQRFWGYAQRPKRLA
eukprot:2408441-Lingulodinium_polyedra.AAC.1